MQEAQHLVLQLFLVFVAAKVFGEGFERLRLPAVLGEILAGVVLGPYAIGLFHPTEALHSIAEIGAIFLLFTVGLETLPHDLLRVGRRSLGVAVAGVVAPFVLGFGYMYMRETPMHESIFVAAAMVATSVGITARVMRDMGVLKTYVASIILGAAVFDDILGMLVLALVSGVASQGTIQWIHLLLLVVEAGIFALFMIYLAPRLIYRIRPRLERMSSREGPLLLALGLCLGLSALAATIGMAAIIGAFFAGLAIAEYAPQWNLHPRIGAITEFLAPFFFFSMGARLDLSVFHGEVLMASIVISLLAIISKLLGCGLPVLRDGWPVALRVGVGMMPRGEVGLIVALVGLNMHMISQAAYGIVMFMTGVTTILAPPLLRLLFERDAQKIAAAAGDVPL